MHKASGQANVNGGNYLCNLPVTATYMFLCRRQVPFTYCCHSLKDWFVLFLEHFTPLQQFFSYITVARLPNHVPRLPTSISSVLCKVLALFHMKQRWKEYATKNHYHKDSNP